MKKKALLKDTLREIVDSKARFLSILTIIMIGVAFFSGISAAGPDMLKTANAYYKDQQLMDLKVVSTFGLTGEDISLLEEELAAAKIEPLYAQDVVFKGTSLTSHVVGYNASDMEINQPLLVEGRMPEKEGEIVLDSTAAYTEAFNIGDQVSFDTENVSQDPRDSLQRTTFEIVGFAKNPLYIEESNRGNTKLGSGILRGIAYVLDTEFSAEYYAEAYILFDDLKAPSSYSQVYKDGVAAKLDEVETLLEDRPEERLSSLQAEIQEEIEDGEAEIASAVKELEEAEETLASEGQKLSDARAELAASQAELDQALANKAFLPEAQQQALEQSRQDFLTAQSELLAGEAEYEAALAEFEEEKADALAEIDEARQDLADAKETKDTLKAPDYIVLDRTSNAGYAEYQDNAERMGSIAKVFPVFFFLLAALISLTTLTRMVEEERTHIGTLKALGYTNSDISFKYFFYALAATLIGVSVGVAVGFTLFPTIIFNAYGTMYNLPPIQLGFYWSYALLSLAVALLSTGVSALVAVRVSLRSNAATLLRRKAPKAGQRIFLERIPFIWERLSFTKKVAARNLFRYKQRMLMTVFGVAGCTGLILTGFGLSDSISGIADVQYGELNQYDAIVALKEDPTTEEVSQYEEALASIEAIDQTLDVRQEVVDATTGGQAYEATLFVPEDMDELSSFVTLRDMNENEELSLTDEGAIITEKLSRLLDVSVGDTLTLDDSDHREFEVPVSGIAENYVGHAVYASPALYAEQFDKDALYNTQLLVYMSDTVNEEAIGEILTQQDRVIGINFVSVIYDAFAETLASLDIVTIVLIISAALLAMVVLYNLTNINVSERIRELSTIKVLGFYDKEVTLYIYRENIVLTGMGIVAGLGVGVLLHRFVLQTAEIDMLMFSRIIHPMSYLYAGLLTLFFSTLVMLIMHVKLKKVDMVEALKAQE